MKSKIINTLIISTLVIALSACSNSKQEVTVQPNDTKTTENLENKENTSESAKEEKSNVSTSNQQVKTVKEKDIINVTSKEVKSEDLQEDIYKKYYANWSEEEMYAAIKEKSAELEKCSFYPEVQKYFENKGITDISNVVEPLYHTDMMSYSKEDFENVPSLIIYIAKNEIYARNGYIFKNQDLNHYFMGQLWYQPTTSSDKFDDTIFNEYEKENLQLLAELDNYKK